MFEGKMSGAIRWRTYLCQIKNDWRYIIIPMQKHPPVTPSPSFLEKFEGKKQTIDRQGLLKLLQAKRNSPVRPSKRLSPARSHKKQTPRKGHQEEEPTSSRPPSPSSQKQKPLLPKRIFLSQELEKSKASKSQRALRVGLSQGRQEESGEANRFKLPIISRSHSQSANFITKHVFTPQVQMIESDRPHRRGGEASFHPKGKDRAVKQMELDQYVLRHLEFLDKFEKQFLNQRPTPTLQSSGRQ